ncbi:MAG: hypothetical protein HYY50_04690 [Candidatus Kerfeldbacteria bacterium]|nr:hypothetical protein [Candidatus Kerfeldbacteria bacterium]
MSWQLNEVATGRPWGLHVRQLPCLIHGQAGSGASFATIIITANLVRRGESVVFLCSRGQAVRSLQHELGLQRPAIKTDQVTGRDVPALADSRLVTIFHRSSRQLGRLLRALTDWRERVVVIKNIEDTLHQDLWSMVSSHQELIISGDVSRVTVGLPTKHFKTGLAFSNWPASYSWTRGAEPHYVGTFHDGRQRRKILAVERQAGEPIVD